MVLRLDTKRVTYLRRGALSSPEWKTAPRKPREEAGRRVTSYTPGKGLVLRTHKEFSKRNSEKP